MRVCYIFREKERKAHSIEHLFDKISAEAVHQGIEVQKWYRPLSVFSAIREARALKADVYHITGDCYFLALFLPWSKTLMTIHDIGMYKNHPKTLKRKLFVWLSFKIPLKLLKISTAISELTKQDLIKILGINNNKIAVIPNPLVLSLNYTPKRFNEDKPTILQIGTGPHKNLHGLIAAVAGMDCKLDIVGKPSETLIEAMESKNIEYKLSSHISTEELIDKYKQCDLVYFASLSEGFGLPILEAQAIGRVVITSNIEPMLSVCDDGGVLVDPDDPLSIREGLERAIANEKYRNSLIEKGKNNLKKYSAQKITQEYIALYKKYFYREQ